MGQYQFGFRLLSNARNCAQNLLCTIWVVQVFGAIVQNRRDQRNTLNMILRNWYQCLDGVGVLVLVLNSVAVSLFTNRETAL